MTEGHITLCFLPNGGVHFYPEHIRDKKKIAESLIWISKKIAQHPELAYHAVGFCEEAKQN